MAATIKVDTKAGRVTVKGVVTVTSAAQVKDGILAVLSPDRPAVVELVNVERADCSFVQLLIATALSARAMGTRLQIEGDPSAVITAAGGSADLEALIGVGAQG